MDPVLMEITRVFKLQQAYIATLEEKCANLEAIQVNLIASIAASNPEIFATFRENAKECLSQLAEKNLSDCNLAAMLCLLTGLELHEKKPRLWIVPPRVSPPTEDSSL